MSSMHIFLCEFSYFWVGTKLSKYCTLYWYHHALSISLIKDNLSSVNSSPFSLATGGKLPVVPVMSMFGLAEVENLSGYSAWDFGQKGVDHSIYLQFFSLRMTSHHSLCAFFCIGLERLFRFLLKDFHSSILPLATSRGKVLGCTLCWCSFSNNFPLVIGNILFSSNNLCLNEHLWEVHDHWYDYYMPERSPLLHNQELNTW